ncbi:MAG TPA: phage tail protein [Gemmatimonadales bacterium]|nr:phage tail protein [Gemmatimonadales bacterium]
MPAARDAVQGDPLVGFNFGVEFSGVIGGYFTEASGLGSEHEIIEHKIVSQDGREIIRKIPGRLKWGDITLKRGITANMDFWEWRKQVEDGLVGQARRNGSVVMFDETYTEVARWNFENAWPSKVSGPSVNSTSNEVGIEEITIVHEGIERIS